MDMITVHTTSTVAAYQMGLGCTPSPVDVTIIRKYELGKNVVTADEYTTTRTWALANGYTMGAGHGSGNYPIVRTTWFDAVLFCNALSELEGLVPCYRLPDGSVYRADVVSAAIKPIHTVPSCDFGMTGYRLPVEAEWEYAARNRAQIPGDKISAVPGMDFCRYCNIPCYDEGCKFCDEPWVPIGGGDPMDPEAPLIYGRVKSLAEVGSRTPSPLGFYDLIGNVLQWSQDAWRDTAIDQNFERYDYGTHWRVVRGASYCESDGYGRPGDRKGCNAEFGLDYVGFRVARTVV